MMHTSSIQLKIEGTSHLFSSYHPTTYTYTMSNRTWQGIISPPDFLFYWPGSDIPCFFSDCFRDTNWYGEIRDRDQIALHFVSQVKLRQYLVMWWHSIFLHSFFVLFLGRTGLIKIDKMRGSLGWKPTR